MWLWIRIILIVLGVPFLHHFSEYMRSESDSQLKNEVLQKMTVDFDNSALVFVFRCVTMIALPIIFLLSGRFRSVPPKKYHIPSWYDSPNQPTGAIILLDFLGWFVLFRFEYAVLIELAKYGRFVEFEPTELTSWGVPISALFMLASMRIGNWVLAYFDGKAYHEASRSS